MLRGVLILSLLLVIESSGNTFEGDQCSSYETSDAFVGNCQRLVKNSSDVKRPFILKFRLIRSWNFWNRFSSRCSLCTSWCDYLTSCRRQNWSWRNHCKWKFKYFERFYLTTVPEGINLPLLVIDVNLCKKIYLYPRKFDKIFTISITEHRNGTGNIKNVSSPDSDGGYEEDDDLLTEMMKSIQQRDSLQVAVQLFDDRIKQYLNESYRTNRTITQQEKMKKVFLASTALEQFMLEFAQYHLNRTVPQIQFNGTHVDLQLRRNFYQNESEFLLQETKGQNFVRIPAENFHNGSVVLGVMYKDLHEIFLSNHSDAKNENRTSRHLNTIIMSATIAPRPVTLKENVTLAFRNLQDATLNRKCMFLNMSENSLLSWSQQGCHVVSMDNLQTECRCSHMTHFAVLMQFDTESGSEDDPISKTDKKALEILTYLGLTLSSIGISLTILGYVFLTDMKGPLSQIRVSLVTSLGAGQTIFLAGIGATENKGACVTVAALVQYFLMAAFCWMLVEGFYLYLFVVKVYNVSNKLKTCHAMSWGVPAVIVALSLSIAAGKDGVESFVSDEYCWLSSANNLIWIFIVFVVLIELLNILILARVVKEMTRMQQAKDSKTEQIRLGIRTCLLLVPLLGFTWLFGLLSPFHKAFAYIFTIFNTTQGFLIFLLHCVRNTEIRAHFKRKIHVIFPAIKDDSGINSSTSGNASLKKIKVKPSNRNSKLEQVKNNKLDDSPGGNGSLNKIEVKPSNRNSKLEQAKNSKLGDSTRGNVSLNKIEVKPSNIGRNSKLEDSGNNNVPLKKTEVKPSDKNSRLNDTSGGMALLKTTEVKPSSRNNKLNGNTNANASLKKTEVKPSNKNGKSVNFSTGGNASLKNTEVKPSNRNIRLNYKARANPSLKKTEVHPSGNNGRSNGGGRSIKT